jgi:uncharacterized protein YdaU (DUF1376 family)
MHYYQFNLKDYKAHTEHLSEMEDLAYRRMIDWCYLHESGLPIDVDEIARLIRMRTHCESIAVVLREFFCNLDGEFLNKRIDSEVSKYKAKSDKARDSANARWGKKKKVNKKIKPDANALRTECEGNANNKPLTINKELLTKNKEPVLPDFLDKDLWSDFLQMREKKKAENTERALNGLLKKLAGYYNDGHDANAIVQESYENGWKGLFEPKGKRNGNGSLMAKNTANAKEWLESKRIN